MTGRRFVPRTDGRHLSTAGVVHQRYAGGTGRLAYDRRWGRDRAQVWREQVRGKLAELLAIDLSSGATSARTAPPEQPPAPRLLERVPRGGYELQRWEAYPEPAAVLPFLLLVPDGASAQRQVPLVHCYPGTDHPKELLAGEPEVHGSPNNPERHFPDHNRMGWWYVQQGWAALCIDNPATCEQSAADGPTRAELALALIDLGTSYLALSVQQRLQLLRWSRSLPFADRQRIAVSGHSLGTGPALALAVLEPAICALVFNGNLQGRRHRAVATGLEAQPPWHQVPNMLEWFDRPDLMCAVAPRPALVCEGGLSVDIDTVTAAYACCGAADRFTVEHFAETPRLAADRGQPPPAGLSWPELKQWARLHSPRHYFKEDLAVPWLRDVLDTVQP